MEPTNTPTQASVTPDPAQTSTSATFDLNQEIDALKQKIEASKNMPQGLKEKANGMINRLIKMVQSGGYSQEFEPVSEYINWITQLPFGQYTQENLDLVNAKSVLDKYNYGLEPVKSRVMEYLAVIVLQNKQLQVVQGDVKNMEADMAKLEGNSSHSPILCFVGIQGVGKTSMAKAMSLALNRKFMRVSLGGLASVTEIRGIVRGQLNAEPGQIIKSLVRTGSMNPLILLDEIEKVSSTGGTKADVMAALLEILDPEQNSTFMDKYLDYPIDLSKVMFVCTANNLGGISAALLDRLEVIRFGSYTDNDKIMIAKNYLLPKVRAATGITEEQLSFEDDAWAMVIRPLGFDAGVRQLERTLTELARKVALQIVQGLATGVRITKDNFRQYIPEDMGVYS